MTENSKNTAILNNVFAHPDNFSEIITVLERMYNIVNVRVFTPAGMNIKLPVYITVQSRGKHRAYGWVSTKKAWLDHVTGDGVAYELNIAAESVGMPLKDIFCTLVHEMVHLVNIQRGVTDCGTSGRHNKKFGDVCHKVGLATDTDDRLGVITPFELFNQWSNDLKSVLEYVARHVPNVSILTVQRDENFDKKAVKAKKRGSNQIKYQCPCCGISCRATRIITIRCEECKQIMIQEM